MSKTIFIHNNPDIDAICGAWLIKTFLSEWKNAEVKFVPPGKETESKADKNPEELYVDIGLGMLDHHQAHNIDSASQKCLDYVLEKRVGAPMSDLDQKALKKLVEVVTEVDNARDLSWPEVSLPRNDFYLHRIIEGTVGIANDQEAAKAGFSCLDAVFQNIKRSMDAQKDLSEKGMKFETSKGKGIALETGNDEVLIEGEKQGYAIVVRKDDKTGGVRIYCRWDNDIDLTAVRDEFLRQDSRAEWYLHQSKKLLLNSSKRVKMQPTRLGLEQVVEILKEKV